MEEVVPCDSLMLAGLLLYVNWHQSDSDSKLAPIVKKRDNYRVFINCALSGITSANISNVQFCIDKRDSYQLSDGIAR
jgi:hypothetical protein